MNGELRNYIDSVFKDAPQTVKTIEIKEEFLQNLTEKYNDMRAEGRSHEAAFNIAAASIGDVSSLVRELQGLPQQYGEISRKNQETRNRRAAVTAIAVALYIFCVVPLLVFGGGFGFLMMFTLAAIATGMLIYNGMTKNSVQIPENTMVEDFQQWRGYNNRGRQVYKSVTSAVWSLGLVVYFLVSFGTGAWHITWIIFLIIGAVNGIIRAIFDLSR